MPSVSLIEAFSIARPANKANAFEGLVHALQPACFTSTTGHRAGRLIVYEIANISTSNA